MHTLLPWCCPFAVLCCPIAALSPPYAVIAMAGIPATQLPIATQLFASKPKLCFWPVRDSGFGGAQEFAD